jgi:alkanesulfonate monooxygenase SsuD/methylene tetrahydromethanopterin reductase-like flavin-dependent oxidoreductase (luciferase family)
MTRIDFGLILLNGPDPETRATFLQETEQSLAHIKGHFPSVWMADHLQFGDADMLEGWTIIAYLAGRHPELQFGHTVLAQSFRNPALLAKMAATLQFLSGGRLVFGIGTGWNEQEYRSYGYAFPPPGVRVAELDEALQIIKALWTEKQATFAGRHYRITEAYCEPKPDPIPPIMIGGRQPRMLRLIARHADWWDVSGFGVGFEVYRAAAEEMARACDEVGRDPATLRRTFSAPCAVAPTEEAARARAEGVFRPGIGFVGTPAQLIEKMQAFVALGVDQFQLAVPGAYEPEMLDLLIHDVLPGLNAPA